ncbi:MAG TPA: sugar phosphate isomerase/epimerase [Solirubrobacteraceae bacterium]|nr:sugar phosphate isomerase/epimerase [Solirubrobacteraceae bacterium]
MRVTFGINNCFAVKRWPVPDEWARVVREELGVDVVQHCLDLTDLEGDVVAEAQAVRTACAAAGLRLHSVFTGLVAYSANLMLAPETAERQRGLDLWSRAIVFAARAGAVSAGGHVGSLSRPDADDRERRELRWSELRVRLADLSRFAMRQGLEALLVENMACDREPCRIAEIESLVAPAVAQHAAITLCLDVGHQCVPGAVGDDADPYAWLRRLGAHTTVVHLQQSDADADHHWPFTKEFNARGRIRAESVLDALAASGAQEVALMLEVVPPFEADDACVLRELRESVLYWQAALRDHPATSAEAGPT